MCEFCVGSRFKMLQCLFCVALGRDGLPEVNDVQRNVTFTLTRFALKGSYWVGCTQLHRNLSLLSSTPTWSLPLLRKILRTLPNHLEKAPISVSLAKATDRAISEWGERRNWWLVFFRGPSEMVFLLVAL